MARYRRSRHRRSMKDAYKGVALALVGIFILAAFLGGNWWLRSTKIAIDEATNCPKTGPKSVHAIIVDRSDPVTEQQAQRIRQVISGMRNEAKAGVQFEFFTFEGDSRTSLRPLLTMCSPGRVEEANALYENPERVRRKYEEFARRIDAVVDKLVAESVRPTSPIMESLRAAALTAFGSISSDIPLQLTLVSDMIQNTPMASQYREAIDFEKFASRPVWAQLRPSLKNADVAILYVLRPEALRAGAPIQNRGHQLFWEQFIVHGGGYLRRIEPI